MRKRNIVIIVTAILAVIIGLSSIFVYKNIKDNNELEAFNEYVEGYKVEISNYLLTQHKDKYDGLITKTEQLVSNKEVKNIDNIKQELIVLKDEIVKANLELINGAIAEIESIDISKVEDKDSIKTKIDEIKKLRDDNKFIVGNEVAVGLKDEINKKLEEIRVEEEKKKAEEEAKKLEEERKKAEEQSIEIFGSYSYAEYNKNGVFIKGYSLTLKKKSENSIDIFGFHDATTTIIKDNKDIDILEATKEDEGYANHRSGSMAGSVEYLGNKKWTGYIWDDQGNNIGDGMSPSIPIDIVLESNDSIVVTVGDNASPAVRGTKNLVKE